MARANSSASSAQSSATIGFEAKLWLTADKLRNNMDAAEYKHVVLGLIFLKYISDTFEEHRAKLLAGSTVKTGDYAGANAEDPDEYKAENVFWVPKEARWSHLQASAKQPTIGKTVDDAMVAIERDNPRLKGVLPKDYARPGLDKQRLGELIDVIATEGKVEVRMKKDEKNQNYEGRKRPQGPHQTVCAANHPPVRKPAEIDGSASARQATAPLWNFGWGELSGSPSRPEQSRVHRKMRRLATGTGRIRVLAGTPRRWRDRASDQTATASCRVRRTDRHLRHHHQASEGERLTAFHPSSFILQTSPAWVQHFSHHLAPHGMAGFVLANGSMSSNQSGEGDIRRALIEADLVDCMVALPGQLFHSTQVPICLRFRAKTKIADAKRGFRERVGLENQLALAG